MQIKRDDLRGLELGLGAAQIVQTGRSADSSADSGSDSSAEPRPDSGQSERGQRAILVEFLLSKYRDFISVRLFVFVHQLYNPEESEMVDSQIVNEP